MQIFDADFARAQQKQHETNGASQPAVNLNDIYPPSDDENEQNLLTFGSAKAFELLNSAEQRENKDLSNKPDKQ